MTHSAGTTPELKILVSFHQSKNADRNTAALLRGETNSNQRHKSAAGPSAIAPLAIRYAMDKKTLAENIEKIKLAAGENSKIVVESTKHGVAVKITLFTKEA